MKRQRYALRFPEMQAETGPESLYSERGLQETGETFERTFDAMHSLIDYVIQRNQTRELGKQLRARRKALDAQLAAETEQERIALREDSKRLRAWLKEERRRLAMEMELLTAEDSQRVSACGMELEKARRTSQTLRDLICHEQEVLDQLQPYLERLKDDLANRKEYSQYCDLERRAYERIRRYLESMV